MHSATNMFSKCRSFLTQTTILPTRSPALTTNLLSSVSNVRQLYRFLQPICFDRALISVESGRKG